MSSRPLPPPNRTCGSPAYGSPVRGFTCNRTDGALHRLRPSRTAPVAQSRRWASVVGRCRRTQVLRRSDFVEQTVPTSAFNPLVEGSQHALGPHRWFDPSLVDLSDGFSRLGHSGQVSVHRCVSIASPFLPPLARTPLEGLHSYYGGSDSCPALLAAGQVSLVHLLHRGPPSVANHPWSAYGSFVSYPYRTVGVPMPRDQASPLASRLAPIKGRNAFLIVRTRNSPRIALHPASRRRSYLRVQARRAMA